MSIELKFRDCMTATLQNEVKELQTVISDTKVDRHGREKVENDLDEQDQYCRHCNNLQVFFKIPESHEESTTE